MFGLGCVSIFPVLLGFLLDYVLGDPDWLIKIISHPVIYIGKLITSTEKHLRRLLSEDEKSLFIAGILLFIIVIFLVCSISFSMLKIAYSFHFLLGFSLETLLCFQILATKSLDHESIKVYHPLNEGNIPHARLMLSYIVGRDTEHLNEEQIIKATVETVAENTTDGVVAPLFFLFLGGAVGGLCYKAVNTLDSMVGYKNDKYLYFGRFSAKADDVFNYIPARIAAIMMIFASFLLGFSWKNAIKIFKRDRFCHKSPNSAQTESVMAGALGVELAGDSYYFGKLVKKDKIGDSLRNINAVDIISAIKIMKGTGICSYILFLILYFFF